MNKVFIFNTHALEEKKILNRTNMKNLQVGFCEKLNIFLKENKSLNTKKNLKFAMAIAREISKHDSAIIFSNRIKEINQNIDEAKTITKIISTTKKNHVIFLLKTWTRSTTCAEFKQKQIETIIKSADIKYTILKPGPLIKNSGSQFALFFKVISSLLGGMASVFFLNSLGNLKPMSINMLIKVILQISESGPCMKTLRGHSLWKIAKDNDLYRWVK